MLLKYGHFSILTFPQQLDLIHEHGALPPHFKLSSCQVTPKSCLILKTFLEVDDPHIFSTSSASRPLGDVIVFLLLSSGLEGTGAFRSHLMSSLTAHPHHVTGNSTEAAVYCINKMFSYFLIICFFLRKSFFFLTLFFEKAVLFKIFIFARIYVCKKGWEKNSSINSSIVSTDFICYLKQEDFFFRNIFDSIYTYEKVLFDLFLCGCKELCHLPVCKPDTGSTLSHSQAFSQRYTINLPQL